MGWGNIILEEELRRAPGPFPCNTYGVPLFTDEKWTKVSAMRGAFGHSANTQGEPKYASGLRDPNDEQDQGAGRNPALSRDSLEYEQTDG